MLNVSLKTILSFMLVMQLAACQSVAIKEESKRSVVNLGDKGKLQFKALKEGDVQWVTIADLVPTQMNIGQKQNAYKLARWQKEPNKLFEELCEAYGMRGKVVDFDPVTADARNPTSFECAQPRVDKEGPLTEDNTGQLRAMDAITPVYVAPNGELYITDGHHTNSRFADMVGGGATVPVLVNVVKNLSHLESMGQFWEQMEINDNAYLLNNGEVISYLDLPRDLGLQGADNLKGMVNDEFRAITYYTRGIGWDKDKADAINFLEYYWAEEYRPIFDIKGTESIQAYSQLLLGISTSMVALASDYELENSGKTTKQLGQLDEVSFNSVQSIIEEVICEWDEDDANDGELKLGKLGWAFYYEGIAIDDFPAPCNNVAYYAERYDLSK